MFTPTALQEQSYGGVIRPPRRSRAPRPEWRSSNSKRGPSGTPQARTCLVLEASGNAFAVTERLHKAGRKAVILDSHQAGKVGKVYYANDRVDAAKIARIYLSGLSAVVWQPDQK